MAYIYAYRKKDTQKIVYVGQTKNLKKRHYQHIHESMNNSKNCEYNSVLARGMRKNGADNYELLVLEECPIDKLDEREKYWIDYYNTFYDGYNCTLGGQGVSGYSLYGDDTIEEIANLLKNSSHTMKAIAEYTNTSLTTVCLINQGECRQDILKNYNFPIRERVVDKQIKKFWSIVDKILNTDLSLREIAEQTDSRYEYVRRINKGDVRRQSSLSYPLRRVHRRNNFDNPELIQNIIYDIQYSDLSLTDIANKYNASKTAITNINQGHTYKQNNVHYPLR